MVWFNVMVILERELPPAQQTEEGIQETADMLMAHHHYANNEENGHFDNTEDYQYGPIANFKPEYTHAVVSPEGLWLNPGPVEETPVTPQDFPELSKVYWERDEQKAKEELKRLNALDKPLEEAREARWQVHVREVFEKFKDRHVIWVRCHV